MAMETRGIRSQIKDGQTRTPRRSIASCVAVATQENFYPVSVGSHQGRNNVGETPIPRDREKNKENGTNTTPSLRLIPHISVTLTTPVRAAPLYS